LEYRVAIPKALNGRCGRSPGLSGAVLAARDGSSLSSALAAGESLGATGAVGLETATNIVLSDNLGGLNPVNGNKELRHALLKRGIANIALH